MEKALLASLKHCDVCCGEVALSAFCLTQQLNFVAFYVV